MNKKCTCWYGSYVKYAGGTGFDIVRYDPNCPVHCDSDEDDDDAS